MEQGQVSLVSEPLQLAYDGDELQVCHTLSVLKHIHVQINSSMIYFTWQYIIFLKDKNFFKLLINQIMEEMKQNAYPSSKESIYLNGAHCGSRNSRYNIGLYFLAIAATGSLYESISGIYNLQVTRRQIVVIKPK